MLSLPILIRELLSFCIQTLYDHPLSLPWIKRCHRNERSIIGQNLGVIDGFLNHWECHLCSVDSRARAGYIPCASEQTGLPVAMHENKMWKKRPCMKSKMLKKYSVTTFIFSIYQPETLHFPIVTPILPPWCTTRWMF